MVLSRLVLQTSTGVCAKIFNGIQNCQLVSSICRRKSITWWNNHIQKSAKPSAEKTPQKRKIEQVVKKFSSKWITCAVCFWWTVDFLQKSKRRIEMNRLAAMAVTRVCAVYLTRPKRLKDKKRRDYLEAITQKLPESWKVQRTTPRKNSYSKKSLEKEFPDPHTFLNLLDFLSAEESAGKKSIHQKPKYLNLLMNVHTIIWKWSLLGKVIAVIIVTNNQRSVPRCRWFPAKILPLIMFAGQAHGLAFSVKRELKSPSLVNIYSGI